MSRNSTRKVSHDFFKEFAGTYKGRPESIFHDWEIHKEGSSWTVFRPGPDYRTGTEDAYGFDTLREAAGYVYHRVTSPGGVWDGARANRYDRGWRRNPPSYTVFEVGVDDPGADLHAMSDVQLKQEIAYLKRKMSSAMGFGGSMMSQNVWAPRLEQAQQLLKRNGPTENPDDRWYWSADRIRLEYDRNPDLTLKRLSLITGRTVAQLKRILQAS